MATKILVVGAVEGSLQKAFQKISKLHSKTNFAFALVTGDLFASIESTDDLKNSEVLSLLNGSIKVPLTTYFTVGSSALPPAVQEKLEATGEVCSNLIYLGRKGTLKTHEGIKIVSLGGRLVQSDESLTLSVGKYDPLYLENEARGLYGAHSAHILLTNQWPESIAEGSNITVPEAINPQSGVKAVSNLCATLKPRYHFSSTPSATWSREPFLWPKNYENPDSDDQVTRFISLASVSTSNKEWMSAFTLDISKPAATEGAQRGAPFGVGSPKRKRTTDEDGSNGNYRYTSTSMHNPSDRAGGRRSKKARHNFPPSDPASCFMCLSNPTFNSDMLVSIAEESFLTVLKGPLPKSTTFPQLVSSGHLMIIPMYHAADELAHGTRSTDETEREFSEMTRYRHALHTMLSSNRSNTMTTPPTDPLGAVVWEVNRTGIRHFHWQFLACPSPLIRNGLVEAAFKVAGEKNEYPKFAPCDPDRLTDQRSDFFRVWIWEPPAPSASVVDEADAIANGHDEKKGVEKSLWFPIPTAHRFNIQFGREVMAGLLGLEDRGDWRQVPAEEGDESRDAVAWKQDFGEWDFAMA